MRLLTVLAVIALSLLERSKADAAITDDLVGLYSFENSFLDSSGSTNTNHGSPVNSPGFTTGKVGTALSLTGVQDYLSFDPMTLTDFDFGNSDTGSATDFSMAMWIRQDDFLSDPAVLSNKDWSDGNNTGINWAPKGNGIFDLNTKGSSGVRRDLDTLSTSFPLTVGSWNLVVMSVDRDGSTELYINGSNTGSIPVTSSGTFNGGLPWNLGQDGTGTYSVEFTGAVDEFAVWRRAVSSVEADELWNGGAGIALGEQIVESVLKLVVDRGSGSMTIENNTAVDQDLIGYQITSAAGAFDPSGWQTVSGRLDAAGDGSIDADDNWLVATSPASVSEFAEISLGKGTLPSGGAIELGTGTWAKFYAENSDMTFQYADGVGDELINGTIEYVGGASAPFSFAYGDLNFDGTLNSEDWMQLQTGFGQNLSGQSEAQRYRFADLNSDGVHNLDDILEFQIAYDEANGAGAFESMLAAVPEPHSFCLIAMALLLVPTARRRVGIVFQLACFVVIFLSIESVHAELFFAEDFDGLALGSNVDEGIAGSNVWSATPPPSWSIDNSGLPAGGVTEWRGWSFADPNWWSEVAVDQRRSEFTKASGAIAVADPDEWDDAARDPGFYNTFLQTPAIDLSGATANSIRLRFDSSWRPEDTQTANVRVSFDGGAATEILRFSSANGDDNFKSDATNETIELFVNNPESAATMTLEFGMIDAGNDWWWAIDNIEVFSALTLQVDVQTGELAILGDASVDLKGYEILSPGGSNSAAGWTAGNLAAQGFGNVVPAAADFNSSGSVDSADLAVWQGAYATTTAADSENDGDSDGSDYLRWQRQSGSSGDVGSTWRTFLATDTQLIEAYLLGSSTISSDVAIGVGYDTTKDLRDLQFSYTTTDNEKLVGDVRYVNVPGSVASVPESSTVALLSAALMQLLINFRLPRSRA